MPEKKELDKLFSQLKQYIAKNHPHLEVERLDSKIIVKIKKKA